ncbi:MAG: ribosome recycling factor [Clostridiales bacterium]|nr:ribosome recycling factor [Clostridiales bacterium]
MIKDLLTDAESRMEKVIENMVREYGSLRAGRANPALLDKVMVECYGSLTPVNQTANISCPEPRLIVIQPWDKNNVAAIERAIMKSDLGITPMNDGNIIRLSVPQLTEERRRELVKLCSKRAEEAKVAVRNVRRDLNDDIKALEKAKEASEDECKKALDDTQKLTDRFIKRVDEILQKKEAEIMEV